MAASKLRAKRFAKYNNRARQSAKLNLTSLMDIFTILVFFLMVNSSEVQVLQSNSAIKLPDSVAKKKPKENIIISVNKDNLVVQGRTIMSSQQATKQEDDILKALKDELEYQAAKAPAMTEQQKQEGRGITIMGDQKVHYQLLKKIMATCAETDYRNISLAVNKTEAPKPDAAEG